MDIFMQNPNITIFYRKKKSHIKKSHGSKVIQTQSNFFPIKYWRKSNFNKFISPIFCMLFKADLKIKNISL